jgi:hypothetical protein
MANVVQAQAPQGPACTDAGASQNPGCYRPEAYLPLPCGHEGPAQHTYRFALLKKWFSHEGGVPIYAVDRHPEVPLTDKIIYFCTPAVAPEEFYRNKETRW